MPNYTTSYSTKGQRPTRRSQPQPHMRRNPKGGYQLPRGAKRTKRRSGATYLHRSQGFGGRRRGYRASGNNSRKPYALIAIGCAFLFFVASIIWYANRSVDITVNDETVGVRINSTIQQYIDDNGLSEQYDSGNLLAVDDSVLERGAGDRYAVTLDGEEVPVDELGEHELTGGEVLTIGDGKDVYEEHDVEATTIEPTITIDGHGAVQYVSQWGIPGRSEVWTGHTSGKTQDRGVVQEVVNCEVSAVSVVPDDGERVVALTFDEGPSEYTEQILEILEEKDVEATFFLSGDAVDADPEAASAIAESGNEIGSNTYSDTSLAQLSGDDLRSQITRGFDAIENATGKRVSLLRAPFGTFPDTTWCESMDLVSAVISWNVDSGDWLLPGAESVADTVVSSVKPGNVVLLTDSSATGAQLVEALPQIIDRLRENGYEILSLSDLIATDTDLAEAVDLTKVSMPEDAALPVIASEDDGAASSDEAAA